MDRTGAGLDRFNRLVVALERDYLAVIRGNDSLETLRQRESLTQLWRLVDEDPLLAVAFTRIKSGHAMTPRHGVNCMLLARAWTLTGHQLGTRLDDFSFCALIHDLGHWRPDDLAYVFGAFTHEEARKLRLHTRTAPWFEDILDPEMVTWIENHHEQPDGRGYPLGQTDPPLLAQALRVVDCYEGLTTPRRFRPTYTPHEAMIVMQRWSGYKYARGLFKSFQKLMGRYPLGTYVQMDSGLRAVVVAQDLGDLQALTVTNQDGDPLPVDQFERVPIEHVKREAKHWYWRIPSESEWSFVRPDLADLPRAYLDEDGDGN